MKKDKYMKGWKVGQPMTYSEIDRLIKMVQDEIEIRKSDRKRHEKMRMKDFRIQETSSKKVLTRKTRIERAIQTLETTKK